MFNKCRHLYVTITHSLKKDVVFFRLWFLANISERYTCKNVVFVLNWYGQTDPSGLPISNCTLNILDFSFEFAEIFEFFRILYVYSMLNFIPVFSVYVKIHSTYSQKMYNFIPRIICTCIVPALSKKHHKFCVSSVFGKFHSAYSHHTYNFIPRILVNVHTSTYVKFHSAHSTKAPK